MTSIEEYNVTLSGETVTSKALVGIMHYSFDKDGKQFRKKYVDANGNEQKYLFEYRDENNVATELPTGVISHAKADHLGRRVFDELQLKAGFISRKFNYHEGVVTPTHTENGKLTSAPATKLVKKIEFFDGRTIEYEYDAEERITKVIDSVAGTTKYTYDKLGQLMSEKVNGVTVNAMTYDGYGNIRAKNDKVYAYDSDCGWIDKLTSVNGNPIVYDENGNPTTYLGHTLTWEKGRQLKSFDGNTYTYNNNGIRTSKSVGCVTHTYTIEGTNIIKETWDGNTLVPLYDLEQNVCGIIFNSTEYYFYKNLQGDVIAITNNAGTVVARYTYDAWGVPTIVNDASESGIATINPFRYRSYYYDSEIGMYYLQSRYYDPSVGRFITRDNVKYSGHKKNFSNLYVYCANSPTNMVDISGRDWGLAITVVVAVIIAVLLLGFFEVDQTKVDSPTVLDQSTFKLYIKLHHIYMGGYHSCLAVFAENVKDEEYYIFGTHNIEYHESDEDTKFFTIGAGGGLLGFFGKLTAGYNRDNDVKMEKATVLDEICDLDKDTLDTLLQRSSYYIDNTDKRKWYGAFPGSHGLVYNCNSFTHGLLNVTGLKLKKKTNKILPGWEFPLPPECFGVS